MKKSILLLLIQILACQGFAASSNGSNVGMAAKQGRSSASAVAWSVAGISLLLTIGIITAIAIQNEK